MQPYLSFISKTKQHRVQTILSGAVTHELDRTQHWDDLFFLVGKGSSLSARSDKSENRDFGRTPGPSKRAPNLSRNSSGDGAFGKAGSLAGPARLSPGPVFAPGLGDVYGGANGQSWIGSAQLYSAADFGLP
eukprot:CAMPEP_0194565282 /NCGR_PEP_ID=MMETSP0292-20121207/4607_1 /TAXON_ID=39354 /ORGANISM="Heterosigma akashiwo, Strain CCMP2393" /LENGTH=131 /DNA_ID=CAMNT_0039414595 /DNA_START=202 /DNA_END=594 /DNA_ORIENTATION=-